MGNRLSQIATRTGDAGTTGLGDNSRVSKNSLRVHAMGDVDELNSSIGVLLCEDMPADVRELLVEIQHQLFNLGGELSIPGFELLKPEAVIALDEALERYNAQLPKLKEFILPAGSRAASLAHVCRTVARRAERAVVALGNDERRRRRLLEERAPEARGLTPGRRAQRGSRMAMVMREVQVSSPASLCNSICHTWVLRPRCTGRAMPVTQPLDVALMWLALMSSPTARWPLGQL